MKETNASTWILIVALVLAVGGTSASIIYFREAQKVKVEAEVIRDVVGTLEQENEQLRERVVAAAVSVPVEPEPVVVAPDVEREALVAQIHDLEERLRAKDEELTLLRANAAGIGLPDTIRSWVPEDRRDWIQNLQTNDPERYKEIMDRREQARQAARYDIAKKASHFLYRDESSMSDEEAEQHQRMMSLLHESLLLTEQLNADLPGDQRRDIGRNLRRNMRELSPLLESERDKEFYRVGKDLGYTDSQAVEFASYIRNVIELTSVQSVFRSSMRAMGGGPWGNPGPPQ